jgi:peptide/nickel transport system substrate-binding protein
MKKLLFILIILVSLFSIILTACGEKTPATTAQATTTAPPVATTKVPAATTSAPATTTASPDAAKYGGVYIYPLTVAIARPIGLPSEGSGDSYTVASPSNETFISVDMAGNIIPKLAVSWNIAADGKSMTLKLRQGVKFHDGSDFNAAVAKWNLDQQIVAKKTTDWTSTDIVDDYTVRINVKTYKNTMLTDLATGLTQMISKAFVDKNGVEAAKWHPVGTGPYIYDSYERDATLTYKRNPNYWDKTKPQYLDGIRYVVLSDATVRKLAFQKGDVHEITTAGIDAQELQKAGYKIYTQPGGTFALIPDSKNNDSPWSNINVRLAASYSLNREALSSALGFGFTKPAYQIYPSFEQTAIPNLDKHIYNPDKAKGLLRDAGYPAGFKTNMWVFSRVVPSDYPTALAAQLRAVGINIEVQGTTSAKYDELRYSGWNNGVMNHALLNYSNYGGMGVFFTGLQFPSVKLPAGYVEGSDAAATSKEPQNELIQALMRIIYDDVMVVPYMEETKICFLGKGVHNDDKQTFNLTNMTVVNAWLEPSARK